MSVGEEKGGYEGIWRVEKNRVGEKRGKWSWGSFRHRHPPLPKLFISLYLSPYFPHPIYPYLLSIPTLLLYLLPIFPFPLS